MGGDGIFLVVKWLTLLIKTTNQEQGIIIKFLKAEGNSQYGNGT